jgi:hypothetical protein
MKRGGREEGLSLVEVLFALALGGLVVAGLSALVGSSLATWRGARDGNRANEEVRFALDRIAAAVHSTSGLLVPATEGAPRSVLVLRLEATVNADGDGWPDADNDRDGLLDEDPGGDSTADAAPGVVGIDDDGDGVVDEGGAGDDDEDGASDEDGIGKGDSDADGREDEDPPSAKDDDKDGRTDEDGYEPVVFRLQGQTLLERRPAGRDTNGDATVDGRDYVERPIAENVSRFEVRLVKGRRGSQVDIQLTVTLAGGVSASGQARVRVGGYR